MSQMAKKIDRYGKKYCWIAYHEIAGFRQDKGLSKQQWKSNYEKRFKVDIDPSFPEEIQDIEIIKTNYLTKRIKDLPNWIVNGPTPDITPYLLIESIQNEHGPWVLLDGYIQQEDLNARRDIFIFPCSLFLKKEEFTEIVKQLRRQDLGGRWLPEIPEYFYAFAGEVPWCETYLYNGNEELSFTIGKETKRVPVEETEFLKNGKKLNSNELLELFEVINDYESKKLSEKDADKYLQKNKIQIRKVKNVKKQIIEKTRKYEVIIPISTLSLGSHKSDVNPGIHAYVLSKELCEALDLTSKPQSYDLYDKSDRRASITLKWGRDFHTYHKLIYIRKDLLDRILQDKKLKLIWGVWGERRYKDKKNIGLQEFAEKHQAYKVFQKIITY